jgi:hypothetical protein
MFSFKRSRSNEDGDEEKFENFSRSMRESLPQTKILAALNPPVLANCEDLVSLLLFLERWESYSLIGGEVPLLHCSMTVVENRLEKGRRWRDLTNEQLARSLLEAFAPKSRFELFGLLQKVQLKNQGARLLNVDSLPQYWNFEVMHSYRRNKFVLFSWRRLRNGNLRTFC